jgi:hypothetical protein
LREGGAEAARRITGELTGTREELTAVGGVELADTVRPFSRRISLLFAADESAGEFAFTKRCSRGSYAIEESLPSETARTPELPSTTVLETRAGGPVAGRLPLRASRGGDFNVSHFCPRSTGSTSALMPLIPTFDRTPRSRFRGVFPF